MLSFTYYDPVKVIFGKGTIVELAKCVPRDQTIMVTYGGGSVKRNGVYDQVIEALKGQRVVSFGGIESNPSYETLMKAVHLAKAEGVGFLLAVGGGSVLDGTKFIAAAARYEGTDPWDILERQLTLADALPFGAVITLPATGSEMNSTAVISRASTREKVVYADSRLYPQFSILDPETTYSLPPRQISNGIVDTFIHVTEQYLTYDVGAKLQDRLAEGILATLIEETTEIRADAHNYAARANLMWCATLAQNGLLACGVPEDWASHRIGHELTAFFGLDHAQSLAVVHPAVLRHEMEHKLEKLVQFGRRVWNLQGLGEERTAEEAIAKIEAFFHQVGVPTRLSDHGITLAACNGIVERFTVRGSRLGEHKAIDAKAVAEILALCA